MSCFGLTSWSKSRFSNAVEAKATRAFEEAWGAFKPLLASVGFEGRWHGLAVYHPGDDDLAALACAEVEAAMPAWRAEQARRKAETAAFWERVAIEQKARDAARAQREVEKAKALAERPARVKRELAALVEGRLWLLQPADQKLAIELAAAGERMSVDAADRLVQRAAKTLGRAAERTSRPDKAAALARVAENPSLVEVVREGCRWMSSLDADRAHDANGAGWSKTTTISGHYLAEQASLTEAQAAYGLGLLHTHRGQLPPDLRGRLGL